ncbi:MAG: PIG-L family deacetylase [Chlamydiales bacterium]|nr:PIG-L family deacetylase [Chlamydiales bacterium]
MVDIMAIGTHPDDVEFGCGGILCREAAEGRSIVIVDLTPGQKATNGTPAERRQEALASAKIIGAERICLDFDDCEIIDSYAGRLKLVEAIRKYQPRLVLAPLWSGVQQHPDHTATGYMARAACRYARFAKILPDLPTHWVEGILHYSGAIHEPVDFLIDVSNYITLWTSMMECHHSQMKTYDYIARVTKTAQYLGVMIGCQYAQGLAKSNPIQIDDIMKVSRAVREL